MFAIDCSWTRTGQEMKCDVESHAWEQVSSFLLDDGRIGPLRACVLVLDNYLYLTAGGLYDSKENTIKPTGYVGRYDIVGKRCEKIIANMSQAIFDACGTALGVRPPVETFSSPVAQSSSLNFVFTVGLLLPPKCVKYTTPNE